MKTIVCGPGGGQESIYSHQRFKIDGTFNWNDAQDVGCDSDESNFVTWVHDDALGASGGFIFVNSQWWYVVALDAFGHHSTEPNSIPGLGANIVAVDTQIDETVVDVHDPDGAPQSGHATDATNVDLKGCFSDGTRVDD